MIKLRASAATIAWNCMASQCHPGPVCESQTPEARLGLGVHACLGDWIWDRDPNVEEVAQFWGVDANQTEMLLHLGKPCWNAIGNEFTPDVETEKFLIANDDINGIQLSGHIDVFSRPQPDLAVIADWKTGVRDPSYIHQMRAYALLVMANYPEVHEVKCFLVYLREGVDEPITFTRAEIEAWWGEFAARLVGALRYNPGSHCGFCQRQAGCQARIDYLRAAHTWVTGTVKIEANGWGLPAAHELGPLLIYVRDVENACKQAREIIKAAVIGYGSPVPDGKGAELALVSRPVREIDYPVAAPILTQQLGSENVLPLLEIGITNLEKLVRSRADRGMKKQAVEDLMERLEAAGAIRTTYQERLEIRHVKNSSPAIEHRTASEAEPAGGV